MTSVGMQGSIFDLDDTEPQIGRLGHTVTRRELTDGAWVDLRPGWITGADALFDALHENAAWRAERRRMYDRVVDVPRLLAQYPATATLPDPLLADARDALSAHYRPELPEGFATAGLCLYRDGADSVAWHGDRFGRGATDDTMVAILSLGSPRPLALRPNGGGPSIRFLLSAGDLLVMGGSCQRTWEHAIPKCTGVGPRISVQFRPPGVW
ncbi:alpha-ketoglutarate-dependent dioxygenase AlkB [Gordonia sp. NB41Y]|uniref:alpha-ketoglutarate-dependent dioxygenase AlkB n=1 Tax=Gordonia sp. NB41Y TaxID=875808 RepID=UPI0006B1657A|nr:alpha-ketoglutarate-dependent dioxygenase AlkB [Gordonia sp. NB41Y]KOY48920.1 DNA repair protein [Gordonia sp. NB41Y]WLP89541.1 alpha-ketoglutarate-dependent dioxygenase AlkB [Gordonia sp. NB41Y]